MTANADESRIDYSDLTKNDQIFRLLVTNVKDYAIFLLDPEGYILSWNEGARRFKGYRAEEIIGKHFSMFYLQESRDSGHPAYELKMAIKHGRYEEEGRRVRKDGTTFWADVIITPLYDDEGVLIGFAKVTRDLTERKLAEQEREEANKRLQHQLAETERYRQEAERARDIAIRANELKSQFVANISHEIRTPMSGILGLTELLTRECTGQTKETAEFIYSSAISLMRLVNDLLDFSKLEAGKLEIRKENFHIDQIVDDVLTAFYIAAQAKQLKLVQNLDKDVMGEWFGDGHRLAQVLQNLVQNAIKFTDSGSVEIRACVQRQDDKQKYVKFTVTDTGPGISKENQEKLFQPFVQVDGSTRRRYGGTGLGLSLCKRIIEMMNGKIAVDSAEGNGSKFWFIVPLETGTKSSCNPE